MNSFEELCTKISQDIDSLEIRSRSRTEQVQIRFNYAVRHQLIELWKNTIRIKKINLPYKRTRKECKRRISEMISDLPKYKSKFKAKGYICEKGLREDSEFTKLD